MKTVRALLIVLLFTSFLLACRAAEPEPEATAVPAAIEPVEAAAPADTADSQAPQPAADLTADFVTYEDEYQGVTLMMPPDWAAENFFITLLASDQGLLDAFLEGSEPDFPPDGAIVFIMAGAPDEFSSSDLEEMMAEALEQMEIFDADSEVVEAPTRIRINGQEAVTAVTQGRTDNDSLMTVLTTLIHSQEHNRIVVLIGAVLSENAGQQLPTIQAIANSVEVGPEGEMPDFADLMDFNLFGDAESVFLNETITGSLNEFESLYFSFSGAPTVAYDIIVTPLDDDLETVIDLLDEDGLSLLPDGSVGSFGTLPEIRSFQPEDYGTFYISVRGFAGATGRFELSLLENQAAAEETSGPADPGQADDVFVSAATGMTIPNPGGRSCRRQPDQSLS